MSYGRCVEFLVFLACVRATSTLTIRQEPRAVYNNQTGQFHVQLTCISHHGTTRPLIWTNPLGHELNSSSSDGGEFRLLLPNPVTTGLYRCCALAPNAKTTCPESSSASVLVDNVDARFMVMEAEHSDRVKRMDAKFNKMNDENKGLKQQMETFQNENKALKQQMKTLQTLGEAMTGAMEKLGEKLTQGLGEAMTGAVEKLVDKNEKLGESLTNALLYPYPPSSCYDVMPLDVTDNVHVLKVNDRYIRVFCDQHTAGGGWTVIQRRRDGSVDFYRNWTEYRQGFGDIQGNFWLGLDNIHLLTTARNQTLRVDLQDFDNNTAYAEYRFFAIDGPDSFYRLHVDGYTGTAGNSMARSKSPFSTYDSDHDSWRSGNCAVDWHGAWWYFGCTYSNLNGPYLTSAQQNDGKSIYWHRWKHAYTPLKHVEMKIRPAM